MKTNDLAVVARRGLAALIVGGAVLLGHAGPAQPVVDVSISPLLPCRALVNELSAEECAHFNALVRQYRLSAAKALDCVEMVDDMQIGIRESEAYRDAITSTGDDTSVFEAKMQHVLESFTEELAIVSVAMQKVAETQNQLVADLK